MNRCNSQFLILHLIVILIQLQFGSPMDPKSCCRYVDDTYSCKDCGLNVCPGDIPTDVVNLDLSNNVIEQLDCLRRLTKLETLTVHHNRITKIHRDNFVETPNLLSLDLRYNQLCLDSTSFPNDAFESLGNLQKLQIINNKCDQGQKSYPEEAFKNLVNLRSLSLPGLPAVNLGNGFSKMVNLKRLMFTGLDSNISTVNCDMFIVLQGSSLTHLSLRSSNVRTLCQDVLKPLSLLTYFNVACNPHLPAAQAFEAVNQMKQPTLKSLVIDGCRGQPRLFSLQTIRSGFQNIENLSFRSISQVVQVDIEVLLKVPQLKRLEAGGNFILYYIDNILTAARVFFSFAVESIDMSHFAGYYSDFEDRFCRPGHLDNEELLFFPEYPKNIQPLVHGGQYRINFTAPLFDGGFLIANLPASVHYITAEYFTNEVQRVFNQKANLHNQLWYLKLSNSRYIGPLVSIENLNQLQMLYLDNCSISIFGKNPLDFPSLTHLYLSGNVMEKIEYGLNQSPFALMTKLQVLDLSQNRLTHIIQEAFSNLTHLQILKLADNKLTSADINLSGLMQLKFLDLSGNQITTIPSHVMADLERLDKNQSHSLQVDISGNEFICDCQSAEFLDWLRTTDVNVTYDGVKCMDGREVKDINLQWLKAQCYLERTHLSYILPILAAIIILTLMVVLIWKNRWRFLYWSYLMREWVASKRQSKNGVLSKQKFDIYICNAEEDDNWVLDEMVTKLEKEWSYRTFQKSRDIGIGENQVEHICSPLKQSTVVIFVLTPDFISDTECEMILHTTIHMKQDAFLLFYKEKLPNLSKRHLISKLTKIYSYLDYGSDSAVQRNSWAKLRDFLDQHCNNTKGKNEVKGFENKLFSQQENVELNYTTIEN